MATAPSELTQQESIKMKSYLTGGCELILHTDAALSLLEGTWRGGKMGIMQFDRLMRNLWFAHKENDPYADLYIFKTHKLIQDMRAELDAHEASLQDFLANIRGLKIKLLSRYPAPVENTFDFVSPYTNMVAVLIEKVDYAIRQIQTAKRMGLVLPEKLTPTLLIRKMQRIYFLPRRWHFTGVTRTDVMQNNQKAKQAHEINRVVLPTEVINQEIDSLFLPKIRMAAPANNRESQS